MVEGVKAKDRGVYRCRVDFKIQPTTISRVDLAVNMPPEKPVILDSRGREVGRRSRDSLRGMMTTMTFVTVSARG